MPNLNWPELLLIAVVLVLLFGAKKLPDTARAIGKSLRIFKAETKAMKTDDEPADTGKAEATSSTPPVPPKAIEGPHSTQQSTGLGETHRSQS